MENGIIILIEVVFFGGLCGFCIYGKNMEKEKMHIGLLPSLHMLLSSIDFFP